MKYKKPQITEIIMSSGSHCKICNSEAFSCYLNIDERNDFLHQNNPKRKLLFLHGFASSGKSSKVRMFEELLHDFEIIAPDIPMDPIEALPFLKNLCQKERPDIIVGKCMGGMYCQQMHGFKRICINPTFFISKQKNLLRPGTFEYYNQRSNGETSFTITPEIISHFEEMEKHQFESATEWDRKYVWAIYVNNDTEENSQSTFEKHYQNSLFYSGSPRLDYKFFNEMLIPLIHRIV